MDSPISDALNIESILKMPKSEWAKNILKLLRTVSPDQHPHLLKAFFAEVALRDGKMLKPIVDQICESTDISSPLIEGIRLSLQFHEYLKPGHENLRSVVDRLLDAALSVFSKRGYHEATMEEIAQIAGVGKGTLYRYFKSKEELYHALLEARLKELDDEIQSIIRSQDLDVVDTVYRCFQAYLRFFEHYRGLYRLILREWKAEEHGVYIRRALKRLYPLKKKILEATRSGVFKPLPFEATFYGFMGFLHGIVQRWLDHGCDYALVDDLPVASEILLYGVITEEVRGNVKKTL